MKRLWKVLTAWFNPKPRPRSEPVPTPLRRRSLPNPVMTEKAAEKIAGDLIRLKYLDYVPEDEKTEVRKELVNSIRHGHFATGEIERETTTGQTYFVNRDRRTYRTDAEALGDGSVASYLKYMQAALLLENVRLENPEDRWGKIGVDSEHWKGKRYEVSVNGKAYLVYDTSNAQPDLDTWGLGHKRLVEILNDLLGSANSKTRAYGVAHMGETWVMFLTKEQYDHLSECPNIFQEGPFPVPAEKMSLAHRDYWPNGQPSGIVSENGNG